MLGACNRSAGIEGDSRDQNGKVYHGMIELGEKLDDPYTVENMQEALAKVYPTKAGRIDIKATDLYVRFLPKDDGQLNRLKALDVYLLDHPMDYRIVREGDYYQDPEVGDDAITWQYAVVPQDFIFPEDIRYELLDECFIAEHDPATRADDGIDWTRVEEEAYRLTGNEDLWIPRTKGESHAPAGRITIEDPLFSGGKPFGVAGVKVVCNIFVKIATAYTDRDGYYQMGKTFSGEPRYRLVFQNSKGFNIGINLIIIPASVSTLGKGSPEGMDVNIDADSDGALFRRCAVNNAAYDYYSRCKDSDLDLPEPPKDLRIWIFPDLSSSSTSMLHHGAFLSEDLLQEYLGKYLMIVQIFLPDITVGTKAMRYEGIYRMTVHELAHASHYTQVGDKYWNPYIRYVIKSFITEGGEPYGSGIASGSGYCELGEMWGYFVESTLYKDRYSGDLPIYGNRFWFKPDIFSHLYDRGVSHKEIFRALTSDVTTIDDLKDKLISLYPGREELIEKIFQAYGK